METTQPLILVYYFDKNLTETPEILNQLATSFHKDIKDKNILAYMIPSEGAERLECINPVMLAEADMVKVNKIVEDVKKRFDITKKIEDND